MSDYKPTEVLAIPYAISSSLTFPQHDGLRKDGQPDQRMNKEFADGKVDPVEAGRQGGKQGGSAGGATSGGSDGDDYKPTEHDVRFFA